MVFTQKKTNNPGTVIQRFSEKVNEVFYFEGEQLINSIASNKMYVLKQI